MTARELVTDGILPLKTSDTARMALSWMEDLRLLHLPIVNNEVFLGVVSEVDIFSHNHFDDPIGSITLSLPNAYVHATDHLFDVLRLMHENKLSLVPVVCDDHKYLGSITLQRLIEALSEAYSFSDPGAIIVVEMSANDFVLSSLARIFEDNDTKIISLFLRGNLDSTKLEVNIKTNRIETSALIRALNRYNYNILGVYSHSPDDNDLKERFEAFMKFMNI